MTRILLLAPVGTTMHLAPELESARRVLSPDTAVEVRHLPGLPETVYVPPVESFVPVLVEAAKAAETEGFDAIGISCCSDPGLAEVRAAVSIPVSAPFEATRALLPPLAPLAVCCVDVPPGPGESDLKGLDWVPEIAASYEASDLVLPPTPIPVARPETEAGAGSAHDVGQALIDAQRHGLEVTGASAAAAAAEAGAGAILLACTYWTGLAGQLQSHTSIPVLDPVEVLARHLETLGRAHQNSQGALA